MTQPERTGPTLARAIAEWVWRLAILAALGFIGFELRQLHQDITEPVEEPQSVASTDSDDALDAIDRQLARLNQKVDAIMLVMARAK